MTFSSYQTHQPSSENSETDLRSPEGFRIHHVQGGSRLVVRDGRSQVEVTDTDSYNTAQGQGEGEQGDWRSTARLSSGLPPRGINHETLVTVGGYGESKVKTFVEMGVLREVSPGVFERNGKAGDVALEETQSAEASSSEAMQTPPEVVAAANEALQPFPDYVVEQGAALAISHVLGKIGEEEMVNIIAQASGVEVAETADRVRFVISTEQVKTDTFLKRNGISEELATFYDYALSQNGALNDIIYEQVVGSSMRGWTALVASYKASGHRR